ncbi:hypothetical protein [Psychroserpens damuponensis]|uniref:hypothetical protein n=1 Tax=Psychroserpens damuponensis TaxID=943936 RepID=UPI00126A4F7B|nr:hypothetical protein [Psychroserpens damuponensis]
MKASVKLFLKIFIFLVVFEIALGIGNAYLFAEGTSIFNIKLSTLTNLLLRFLSFPMSIFGRDLPFYAREAWLGIVLTILNIAIQSFIVMQLYKTLRRSKTKNPKV